MDSCAGTAAVAVLPSDARKFRGEYAVRSDVAGGAVSGAPVVVRRPVDGAADEQGVDVWIAGRTDDAMGGKGGISVGKIGTDERIVLMLNYGNAL